MIEEELGLSKVVWNHSKQHFIKVHGTIDLLPFVGNSPKW